MARGACSEQLGAIRVAGSGGKRERRGVAGRRGAHAEREADGNRALVRGAPQPELNSSCPLLGAHPQQLCLPALEVGKDLGVSDRIQHVSELDLRVGGSFAPDDSHNTWQHSAMTTEWVAVAKVQALMMWLPLGVPDLRKGKNRLSLKPITPSTSWNGI